MWLTIIRIDAWGTNNISAHTCHVALTCLWSEQSWHASVFRASQSTRGPQHARASPGSVWYCYLVIWIPNSVRIVQAFYESCTSISISQVIRREMSHCHTMESNLSASMCVRLLSRSLPWRDDCISLTLRAFMSSHIVSSDNRTPLQHTVLDGKKTHSHHTCLHLWLAHFEVCVYWTGPHQQHDFIFSVLFQGSGLYHVWDGDRSSHVSWCHCEGGATSRF